jgi:hypothetical protein
LNITLAEPLRALARGFLDYFLDYFLGGLRAFEILWVRLSGRRGVCWPGIFGGDRAFWIWAKFFVVNRSAFASPGVGVEDILVGPNRVIATILVGVQGAGDLSGLGAIYRTNAKIKNPVFGFCRRR